MGYRTSTCPCPAASTPRKTAHTRLPRSGRRALAPTRRRRDHSLSGRRRDTRRALGFPRAKLTVIPNGVHMSPHPIASGSLVGSVARLEPVKRLTFSVRSAARLADRDPGLRFAIFGSGTERERLEALAQRFGVSEKLELPGYVPMAQAVGSLGIFVLSSYMENAPMSVLEAMAAGVPVVATAVGAIPEIAIDGTAQLVPPGDDVALADAIGRLLADPGLRERQAKAARERVLDRYTADACAGETLALYRRLLGEG